MIAYRANPSIRKSKLMPINQPQRHHQHYHQHICHKFNQTVPSIYFKAPPNLGNPIKQDKTRQICTQLNAKSFAVSM